MTTASRKSRKMKPRIRACIDEGMAFAILGLGSVLLAKNCTTAHLFRRPDVEHHHLFAVRERGVRNVPPNFAFLERINGDGHFIARVQVFGPAAPAQKVGTHAFDAPWTRPLSLRSFPGVRIGPLKILDCPRQGDLCFVMWNMSKE